MLPATFSPALDDSELTELKSFVEGGGTAVLSVAPSHGSLLPPIRKPPALTRPSAGLAFATRPDDRAAPASPSHPEQGGIESNRRGVQDLAWVGFDRDPQLNAGVFVVRRNPAADEVLRGRSARWIASQHRRDYVHARARAQQRDAQPMPQPGSAEARQTPSKGKARWRSSLAKRARATPDTGEPLAAPQKLGRAGRFERPLANRNARQGGHWVASLRSRAVAQPRRQRRVDPRAPTPSALDVGAAAALSETLAAGHLRSNLGPAGASVQGAGPVAGRLRHPHGRSGSGSGCVGESRCSVERRGGGGGHGVDRRRGARAPGRRPPQHAAVKSRRSEHQAGGADGGSGSGAVSVSPAARLLAAAATASAAAADADDAAAAPFAAGPGAGPGGGGGRDPPCRSEWAEFSTKIGLNLKKAEGQE